jgi:hypothetical protein
MDVLSGRFEEFDWVVDIDGDRRDAGCFVHFTRGGQRIGSRGFRGNTGLGPDQLHGYYGSSDTSPTALLAWGGRDVIAIVAELAGGRRVSLELSEVLPEYGICVGAVIVDPHEQTVHLQAITAAGPGERWTRPPHRRRHH